MRGDGAVRLARRRDGEMRRIAERAHALAHTHLCDAARRCYMRELLRRYGKAMARAQGVRGAPLPHTR